ncbi:hypothetical protein TL16_g10510 [Triparma laevis f. inornata]|uniref:Midasin n=1 Tax=Triparma laevis f. inornata TaxID=1714386 RepID=A0A9W7BGC9_9STRA|nr:hypothetical protein TL16_g10510 [Triparma laevis f. inornata]
MTSASAEVQALLTHVLSPLLASSDPSIDASTPSSIPLSELSPSDVKFLVTNIATALSAYIQSAPPSLPSPSASNSLKPSLTTTALRSTPCESGLLTPLSTVLALCSPLVSQILAVILTLPNGPTLHFILKSLTLRSSLSPLASNNLSWALHHIQTLSDLLHSPTFTPTPLTYLELHSLHLLSSHHPLLLNKVTISMLLHTLPHPPKFGLKPLTLSLLNLKKNNSTITPSPLPSPSPSLLTIPTLPPLPLPPHLTPTPTFLLTLSTLQKILLTPKPTILTGSHGTGKTALLELLAFHLGLQLITLNFDDTTDSKSLLGSYVCSEIPGEFIYQPGTLTQACLKGGILVLEDVDNIPLDVLSVIIPIVETRKLPTGEVEDLRLIAQTQYKNVPSYIVSRFTNVFMEMIKNDNVSYIDWFKIIKRYSSYNWITSESEYVREGDKLKCLMDLEECLGYKCRGADGSDERFIECVVKEFEVTRNDIALKMNERIEVIEDDKIVKIGRGTIIKGNIIKEDQSNYVETYQTLKITQAISMATSLSEPVLLVGETGCGKTTVLQKLAGRCGRKLVVQNLSLSTDGGDLLGGYKPVEIKNYVTKIYNTFLHLFASTFSRTQNAQFLTFVKQAYKKHQWKKLSACFIKAGKMGGEKVEAGRGGKEWEGFRRDAKRRSSETGLAFTFTEGILITCIKEGSWILLDEINLASRSTLQRLFSLLDGPSGTITIQERGDLVPVKRHDNFRIFAAMNPATDNGKKGEPKAWSETAENGLEIRINYLPKSMRSRFTEIYVDELKDEAELRKVSERYFSGLITKNGGGGSYVDSTVKIYLQCKVKAEEVLVDSQGKKPSYTLRTLCRGLSASVRLLGFNKMSLKRSVFEGFMLAFAGGLEEESKKIVENLVKSCISVEITKKELSQIPQKPNGISHFICVSPFWLKKGELESIDWTEEVEGVSKFVLTKSAEGNLRALSRSIAAGPWPILIEGPTSAGKTTLVEYLSAKTGHRCVRINNHEHTDVQEYTGSYVTNSTGQLVFREGILVEALRKGWWIILDELNLAPSEVLEALNRLLDDNRELYISETQETVRPHEHFRLFATQNPSGAYGGRKPLSKPNSSGRLQLQQILTSSNNSGLKATGLTTKEIAPTSTLLRLLLLVGKCIQKKEPVLLVGETGCGKTTVIQLYGLLFKRYLHVVNCHANTETGDLLGGLRPLRGRGGKVEEMVATIKDLVELCGTQHNNWLQASNLVVPEMEVGGEKDINEIEHKAISFARDLFKYLKTLYERDSSDLSDGKNKDEDKDKDELTGKPPEPPIKRKRMDSDASTTANPQPIDKATKKIINETMSEIEAAFRRSNALFAWLDGPLVHAMREGHLILLDEMSLAEDAVLERLNSVLEPSRTLTLAEKGGAAGEEGIDEITGHPDFRIFATMNPGGDFGKRELSPALRSRFTEIWVPQIKARVDFELVLDLVLGPELASTLLTPMLDYVDWFNQTICGSANSQFVDFDLSLRDVLGWARFIGACVADINDLSKTYQCFLHGAGLMHLDGLGLGTGVSSEGSWAVRSQSKAYLINKVPAEYLKIASIGFADDLNPNETSYVSTKTEFGVLPFTISTGPVPIPEKLEFSMTAPTTCMNLRRVTRALQLSKPILLEGSPGVGKTSLIQALATASGNNLVRINLSEQTDISDLMGSDLPIAGEEGAKFKWFDGVFLKALKRGDWVLLDELNLASQSVLEGLNSCLDHRSEVFIPELCATYQCPPTFRVFAAQNPLSQGGGRKGLPKSFLNRFTKVFVESLTGDDLINIVNHRYPKIDSRTVAKMVNFNTKVQHDVVDVCKFGRVGFPWEFNLRDVFRWCSLAVSENAEDSVGDFVDAIYLQRMRTKKDREEMMLLYEEVFGEKLKLPEGKFFNTIGDFVQVGSASFKRVENPYTAGSNNFELPTGLLRPLETVVRCVNLNWPCLIIGPKASGKTAIVNALAGAVGVEVVEWAMTPGTDVTELLGCFEQIDSEAGGREMMAGVKKLIENLCIDKIRIRGQEENLKVLNGLWWAIDKKVEMNDGVLDEIIIKMTLEALEKAVVVEGGVGEKASALIEVAKKIKTDMAKATKAGSTFQWVDGVLVKAMQEGRWLSLNNVNFCPSSVLDRLNPLMEMGGELVLTEGGGDDGEGEEGVRVIKPHPNFRLFLSMNSERGEVSRAMRNRCIEVALIGGFGDGEEGQNEADVMDCLYRAGIRDALTAERMIDIHENEVKLESELSSRKLVLMAEMFRDLIKSGLGVERALEESWRCVYSVESGVEMDLDGGVENGEGMFELGEGKWFEDWRLARAQRDARLAIYLKKEWRKGGVGLPRSLVKLMSGKGGGVTKWLKVGVKGEEQEWLKELCCDVAMCEFVRAGGAETLDFEVRKKVLVGGGYELGDVARIYSIVEELGLVEGCPFEFGGRPLDLGSSDVYGVLLKGVDEERVENYNGLLDRVKIEVLERLEAVLSLRRVKDLAEGSSRSKISGMSPIELSYSIAAKGVNANAAGGKKLIVLLVEIFTAIDRMENFGELIKIRDEMWFYLNSFWAKVWIDGDGFDGRFLVYWRWLVKAYIGCGGGVAGVDRMMAKVDEVLGRSGVFSSNLLWKKGGHPAGCMTKEGLEGKTMLLEVGARAVVGKWASLAKLVEEGHGLLYLDEEIKREVLMAQCTLQWELTDEKGEKGEEEEKKEGGNSVQIAGAILAKADKAKVDFTSTLRRKTVDVNIKTVENQAEAYAIVRGGGDEISLGEDPALALMSKFGAIQASVLVDRWSVWEEQKLIDSLCQLTDMNGLKRLIAKISRWIDLTLKGGRKVEVCRGWQTLVWASESVEFSTILRLRSVLLPTMLALNGEDVWNASFNNLGRIEVSISNPILWGGAKEERENSEVERFENFGYARFAHPVVTAQVARLFSEVGDALDGSAVGNQRITLQNAKARGAQAESIISRGLRAIEWGEGWGLVERGVENILTVFAEADTGRVWPDGGAVLEGMRRGEVGNLGGCKDEKFVSLAADVLEPLVKFVVEKQNLNQALVLLGLATLHLYAPTEPLDPGKKPEAKGMNLELRMQVLAARGETKRWNARLSVGGGEEELVGFEKEMKRAEKQRRKVVARPEGSYDRLFKELVQFVKSVGNVDSVLKLAKGEGGSEINWLRSAAEFSSRMLNFYSGYDDVTHPILSGVQMVMKGLRLKTLEVEDNKISSVEKAVGFLLEVPFIEATTELVDDSTFKELGREIGQFAKRKGGGGAVGVLEAQVGVLFAIIQRTEIDLKVGACNIKSAHNILRRCFREIVNIWKIADEKRFEEEEELKGETEEQREERELREQFPDFSREFTKIVERVERKDELESDDEEEEEVEEKITSSFRLTPEQIETLCGVHSRVFGEGEKGVGDGLRRRVFGACFNSAARIIPCVANKISGLDEQVVLGNLLSLSQTSSLCAGIELGRKGGNFNTGSNVGAVLKAEKILSKIVMRITVLLKAYPGHSVLLTIGQIAEKLRSCDVQSPLARVLCGVEVLLAKSQDWEQHASARVKLGEPLEQLSKLVADWRKLELESWASLLDERERNFANKARRIWARLYSVLESGGGSASVTGAGVPTWLWKGARSITLGIKDVLSTKELESLQEISKLCDSFILTAGVGEIETRLSLLASFGGEMKIRGGAKCDALGRILTSLVDYYNSFLHSIVAHKSMRKSECETQLKNEVKLAKWDDQNYYAMAETTQKNHRTLNKLLKNYDEVLNQPVAVLIEELGNKGVREREGGVGGQERGATKLPSDTEMFGAGFAKGEVPSEAR